MDQELKRQIEDQLGEEEILVWTGQPYPDRMAARVRGEFYFALFWITLMLVWRTVAFGTSLPSLGEVFFSLPFYLFGIWLFTSPWLEKKRAALTMYAITDQRVIIYFGGSSPVLHSFSRPGEITRRDLDMGRGDLIFTPDLTPQERGVSCDLYKPGLYGVADVDEVEKLLSEFHQLSLDEESTDEKE